MKITQEAAIEIARLECLKNDWAWLEPVKAQHRKSWFRSSGKWQIFSHCDHRGMNSRFLIDDQTRVILEKGYLKR